MAIKAVINITLFLLEKNDIEQNRNYDVKMVHNSVINLQEIAT